MGETELRVKERMLWRRLRRAVHDVFKSLDVSGQWEDVKQVMRIAALVAVRDRLDDREAVRLAHREVASALRRMGYTRTFTKVDGKTRANGKRTARTGYSRCDTVKLDDVMILNGQLRAIQYTSVDTGDGIEEDAEVILS